MDILALFGTSHHLGLLGGGNKIYLGGTKTFGDNHKLFWVTAKNVLEGSQKIYRGTILQPKIEGVVGEEAKNNQHSDRANMQHKIYA